MKGSALRSTSVLASREDLDHAYDTCARSGAGLMLQQFIPGGPGHDWFFHGYCDATSACRPAFTGVKERSYPADAGLTSLGRSAPNEELREQVIALLAELAYRGILDLDIRLDERTGEYHLLDFNPRLGAQFRLFRDTAGTDVALAAYLDLTSQPIPPGEQVNGRAFLVENYDPISALSHLRRGDLTPRAWLASLRTVDETAWFARDDLRPFGLMCLRMGWRLASRPLRGQPGTRPPGPHPLPGPGARRPAPAAGANRRRARNTPLSQKEETQHERRRCGRYRRRPLRALAGRAPECAPRELPPLRRAHAAVARRHAARACSSSPRASPPTCPTRAGTHTLEAFCQATGRPYQSYGLPVPLDTFTSYGQWFQSELDLKVEEVLVTGLAQRPGGFELDPGRRRAVRGPPGGRRHRRGAFRLRAPAAVGPARLGVHAQLGARRPGGVPAARVWLWAPASRPWSRRRCCTRTARPYRSWPERRPSPGTACP